MLTYTYVSEGTFALLEKPKPVLQHERDAIVKVTLASICSSDLHIKHGSVPRAVPGITVGHEMVGIVEEVGSAVTNVKPGDRVTVNVETFCGECFFCKKGFVNNCTDQNGGWALGCRIDGGADVVLEVAGADSTFRLAWECARPNAIVTVVALYDKAQTLPLPEMYGKNLTFKTGGVDGCDCEETLRLIAEGKIDTEPLITHTYPLRRIAEGYELFEKKRDGVIKVAVADSTFRLAWECARPNAVVTVVALYDKAQTLPLPEMYGKNLTFKTGGVDGCDCEETLRLIAEGRIDTEPLITHTYPLRRIEEGYDLFEHKRDGVIKVAVEC